MRASWLERIAILAVVVAGAPAVATGQVDTTPRMIVEAPNGPWSLKRGERIRTLTADGRQLDGRVTAHSDTDVVIGRRYWFDPTPATRVEFREMRRVEVRRPPRHRGAAMAIGMVSGLAAGAWLGAQSVHTPCRGESSFGPCIDRSEGALVGGLLGTLLGSGAGWLASRSRWHLLMEARPAMPQRNTPR